MDPLVVRRLAKVDGPDKLTSDDYATDYIEVKPTWARRRPPCAAPSRPTIARFFSANADHQGRPTRLAVRYVLEANPVSLEHTVADVRQPWTGP